MIPIISNIILGVKRDSLHTEREYVKLGQIVSTVSKRRYVQLLLLPIIAKLMARMTYRMR
ncbi:MAG: hypothetical protein K1060chlam2_00015 [Chlamydiae bacterium]|nr:hypothetical protein [Chlamydiota bacterium]